MDGDRPFNPQQQPNQGYGYANGSYSLDYQNGYQQTTEQVAKIEQAKAERLI